MLSSKTSSTIDDEDQVWEARHEVYDFLYKLHGCSWREAIVIAYGPDVYLRLLKMKHPKDYERIRHIYE